MNPTQIKTRQVVSSQIAEVGYDAASKVLVVVFNTGAKYAYMNVPEATYRAMMAAPSIGAYWNREKGNYQYQKL